jgi:DNA-binding transcriptional MocR family regulator
MNQPSSVREDPQSVSQVLTSDMRTELLPRDRGSLLYVTPSHQFPTGAIMPLTRQLELLRWAEETDSYIVEDETTTATSGTTGRR